MRAVTIASRTCLIAADLILICVTWRNVRQHKEIFAAGMSFAGVVLQLSLLLQLHILIHTCIHDKSIMYNTPRKCTPLLYTVNLTYSSFCSYFWASGSYFLFSPWVLFFPLHAPLYSPLCNVLLSPFIYFLMSRAFSDGCHSYTHFL